MRVYDPTGTYTPEEVENALRAITTGTRSWTFRYELLDASNNLLSPLSVVASGSVTNNMFADIKRSARFTIKDDTSINYLSHRIKPYAILEMADGGYVEWPQGVFLLSTPVRSWKEGTSIMRDVEGYDQLLVLRDDKVENRTTVASGSLYTDNISALVSAGFQTSITPSVLTLPAAREWEPGTPKLTIINDLLSAINYESAFFDEDGVLVCRPYVSPSDRTADFTYQTGPTSVMVGDVNQTLDLFNVPNKWVITVSNPDQTALTSTYTNDSTSSPTSTVNRGRTIVDFRKAEEAADQTTLDAKAARLAFEASQVYEVVEFSTLLMPIHQNADVMNVAIESMGISAQFSEHEWTLPLVVGGRMAHKVRRVVTLD